jgi:hypothetical protein
LCLIIICFCCFCYGFSGNFWPVFGIYFVVIIVSRVVEFCCIVRRLGRVLRSSLLIFVASVDGDLRWWCLLQGDDLLPQVHEMDIMKTFIGRNLWRTSRGCLFCERLILYVLVLRGRICLHVHGEYSSGLVLRIDGCCLWASIVED